MTTELADALLPIVPHAPVPATATPDTVGAKAYGLLRLAELDLPVPAGFVIGTSLCRAYFAQGRRLPAPTRARLRDAIARLSHTTGRSFASTRRPLLVSVRSGAAVSMPGMLETLLNVGLTEESLPGLLRTTGNPRLVYDCYRRLLRDFMEVVHGADPAPFDDIVERRCAQDGLASARELDSAALAQIARESQALACTLGTFPQDPLEQLLQAVEAVLRSWDSEKARRYRQLNAIPDAIGTGVTVQMMVFGNGGADSGAGVAFTRDPASGEKGLYLDFLFNAQGEDVVSGQHRMPEGNQLTRRLPHIASALGRAAQRLEKEFRDMQDFEFTLESGQLYILQTRRGHRTPWAAVRIAADLAREGTITPSEARALIAGLSIDRIERTRLEIEPHLAPLATAIPASIGVAAGAVVFAPARAAELAATGRHVILVRPGIRAADIEGIAAADGILTAAGGRTSHAAVVARELGKVCLVGCTALTLDPDGARCRIGATTVLEGEEITLDAEAGRIYAGRLSVVRERPEAALQQLDALEAACGTREAAANRLRR